MIGSGLLPDHFYESPSFRPHGQTLGDEGLKATPCHVRVEHQPADDLYPQRSPVHPEQWLKGTRPDERKCNLLDKRITIASIPKYFKASYLAV
jgi:hypothetical protein